jgi:hypothetical protein
LGSGLPIIAANNSAASKSSINAICLVIEWFKCDACVLTEATSSPLNKPHAFHYQMWCSARAKALNLGVGVEPPKRTNATMVRVDIHNLVPV